MFNKLNLIKRNLKLFNNSKLFKHSFFYFSNQNFPKNSNNPNNPNNYNQNRQNIYNQYQGQNQPNNDADNSNSNTEANQNYTNKHQHESENQDKDNYKGYESEDEDPQSFYNQRKKMLYLMTASGIIIVGIYFTLNYLKPEDSIVSQRRLGEVTYVGKAQIGGPWSLIDTEGKTISNKDLQGKYYLIYFGFTMCPDVCPMSLMKIAQLMNKLKKSNEYKYFDLETVFVSVDPDRDTGERIKQYCNLFHPDIIGVTGKSNNDPVLKDVLKKFKIHSSKIYLSKEDEEADKKNLEENVPQVVETMQSYKPKSDAKYSLDHTIVTYLMSPDNKFITYLSSNLNSDEMYDIVLDEIMNDLTKTIKKIPQEKKK